MAYETFELRFAGCGHTRTIPLLHNQNNAECFVCHPELRDCPSGRTMPRMYERAKRGRTPVGKDLDVVW